MQNYTLKRNLNNLTKQWAWNCAKIPAKEYIWQPFDDDTSLTIELQFQKFIKYN